MPLKQEVADPEIPDELRAQLSRTKRPAGFVPKAEEAEEDNAKPEPDSAAAAPVRNLSKFWKALKAVLKKGGFTTTVVEEREEKTATGLRRVKVPVEIEVQLYEGEDGLPYPSELVSGEETRRIRALSYPGSPKMDPRLGDLTPEFVEWLYLNHPYDAAVRYAARNTHVQVAALNR